MTLLDRLVARIESDGPMPFETFMDACLHDREHGFFATGPLRSVKSGDFLTSPEVSTWFGRILGRFAKAERQRIGAAGFDIIDVGAGSGSLLGPLLSGLDAEGTSVWAVDASPAARAALGAGAGAGEWTVGSDLAEVPDGRRGVIVANELLDNLPVALAVRIQAGWEERHVSSVDGGLVLVAAPARAPVAAWCNAYAGKVPIDGMVEVQLAAGRWLEDALSKLDAGALLVVDYGGTAQELEPRRTRGTLRTYRAHQLGPDPLTAPGETDVTVDVNFTALLGIAGSVSADVELFRQDEFLSSWGLRDEISRLRRQELELARGDDAMARLQVRSELADAETIIHPRGLGDFRVLVVRV